MPSPASIVAAHRRLMSCCRGDTVPHLGDLPELAADWMLVLGDLTDEQLADAVIRRLRDPQKGSFWPTPADLLAVLPRPLERDEAAWEATLGRICGGVYSVADLLDGPQFAALNAVGGVWGLRRTEDRELRFARRRFLELCRDGRTERPALEAPRRLVLAGEQ